MPCDFDSCLVERYAAAAVGLESELPLLFARESQEAEKLLRAVLEKNRAVLQNRSLAANLCAAAEFEPAPFQISLSDSRETGSLYLPVIFVLACLYGSSQAKAA